VLDLKRTVSQLQERINHLEYENTILKANATPETLAQLQRSLADSAAMPEYEKLTDAKALPK